MAEQGENKNISESEPLALEDIVTPIFDQAMGHRLALMRMHKLWKQDDLALRLGLNVHTLGMIESGKLAVPRHPFTVTKLEKVFGSKAARFILFKRYEANFDLWGIESKYNDFLMRRRKPRAPGEHWTHRRLRAGLPVRGTFENVSAADMDRAVKILQESADKNTNSVKRKDKKSGQ